MDGTLTWGLKCFSFSLARFYIFDLSSRTRSLFYCIFRILLRSFALDESGSSKVSTALIQVCAASIGTRATFASALSLWLITCTRT